jgi:hypothetical protein
MQKIMKCVHCLFYSNQNIDFKTSQPASQVFCETVDDDGVAMKETRSITAGEPSETYMQ